jgi:hypothetical protein
MYTSEDLAAMSNDTLVNIITSTCDSGVTECLRDMRAAKAELKRRGKRVRLVREPSRWIPGKYGRVAHLVK